MSILVITGASSGLGATLTRRFAAEGNVICAIARGKERLKKIKDEYPESIDVYPLDVSHAQQVKSAFAAIEKKHGFIDILINNAGVPGYKGNLYDYNDFEGIGKTIDINLKGTMYCTYSVIQSMISRKKGRIINIASFAGLRIERKEPSEEEVHLGDYLVSKHGVVAFGSYMAKELAYHGILVTTICPGGIKTPWWEGQNRKDIDRLIKPEDIANAVAFIVNQPENLIYRLLVVQPICEL